MRIERNGPVEPLTPRIEAFLREALRGESMDEVQDTKELRIDYSCLGGLLAIELKALEDDGGDRMENLASELRERDDWPMFLGSAPIQSFIQHTNDPEGLNRRTLERIGRGVVNHLKKANRQLEAHCQTFPRRDTVRALVLVNEDHETYDPHTVSYILWHAVRQMKDGKLRYEHVDLIFYFTERHAQVIDNRLALATKYARLNPDGTEMTPEKKLTEFSTYLFSTLVGNASWGLGALEGLCLSEAPEEDIEIAQHIPSMVFFGVHSTEAVWLRMAGAPRLIAEGAADLWRTSRRGRPETFRDVRAWMAGLSDSEWRAALPKDSRMSVNAMRMVWRELSGA